MAESAVLLDEGLRHHNAGRLTEAAAVYAALLAAVPDHADALHLLGLVRFQQGDVPKALEYVRAAVTRDPESPLYNANLGRIAAAAGWWQEAAIAYRKVLARTPNDAACHSDLAAALLAVRDFDAAAGHAARAVRANPALATAHLNMALAAMGRGDWQAARTAFEQAVVLDGGLADAHFSLGRLAQDDGRREDAERHYRAAVAARPDLVEAMGNLGNVVREQGRPEEAVALYDKALAMAPDVAALHANRAVALHELGDLAGAMAAYDRAVALDPDDADTRRNRALAWLLSGRLAEGFAEYEWRWKARSFAPLVRDLPMPRWRGEPAAGRRLFVHAEQGLGDTIQFARYVPVLAAAGWRVALEVQPRLRDLFEGFAGAETVIASGDPIPPCDFHVPLLSLPYALKTDADTIPVGVPYLSADPARAAAWREKLAGDAKGAFKVGLAWAGDPRHRNDRHRSVPAAMLKPLLSVPNVRFFSLQFGPGAEAAADLPGVVDLAPGIGPLAELAAAVSALDLVVSIDTGVVHLAGALGRPVWTLLNMAPDWRWGLEGETTPWYLAMRLFRQKARGDWAAVVADVGAQLVRERG